MNDNAKLLVAALRSGEYAQTRGRLAIVTPGRFNQIPAGFCCLGVACEVALKAGIVKREELHMGEQVEYAYDGEASVLPKKVTEWLGFQSNWGNLDTAALPLAIKSVIDPLSLDGNSTSLTSLNDKSKLSFSQIADVIESEPRGLFRAPEPLSGPI